MPYQRLAGAIINETYKSFNGKIPQDIRNAALFFGDTSADGDLFFWLGTESGRNPSDTVRMRRCKGWSISASFAIGQADVATRKLEKDPEYIAAKHKKKGEMKLALWLSVYRKHNVLPKIKIDKKGQPIAVEYNDHADKKRAHVKHVPPAATTEKHLVVRTDGSMSRCRIGEVKFSSTKAALLVCIKRQEDFECEGCPCGQEIMAGRRTKMPTNWGIVKI